MTKQCKCGRTKTIQPYGNAHQIPFTCAECQKKEQLPPGPAAYLRGPNDSEYKAHKLSLLLR